MAINTRSGAALIEIGEGLNKVTFTDSQQLNDASFKIERDQFEHKTQASSKAVKYIITGIEGMLEMSIADVSLDSVAKVFYGSTLETSSTASATTSNPSYAIVKRKIEVGDYAGTEIEGQKVVVKPYPQLAVVPAKPVTGDVTGTAPNFTITWDGVTYTGATSAAALTLAENAWAAKTTQYNNWVSSWITFPNGALVDINGTNLAYGLETQQEINLTIRSLPDVNGVRIIFGDATIA